MFYPERYIETDRAERTDRCSDISYMKSMCGKTHSGF